MLHEEQIRGLHVAMNDAARVRLGERLGNLYGKPLRLANAEPASCQTRAEVLAFEPLHREDDLALLGFPMADIAHDLRPTELGEDLHFTEEARALLGPRVALRVELL